MQSPPLAEPVLLHARKRITNALFATQGLFTASTIVAFTLTPVIAVQLSGTESAVGLPGTLTLVGRAVMAYPIGWLMDRAGRRRGLSLGYFVGVLGAAISVAGIISGSLVNFLLGAFLLGVMRGAAEQGRFVAAEVQPISNRSSVIGTVVFAGTFGSVFGPLLVAPSSSAALSFGVPEGVGPFVLAGALLILALLVSVVFLRPDPLQLARQVAADEAQQETRPAEPNRGLRVLAQNPMVRLAVLALVVGQLVMTLLMVITPVHMTHLNHETGGISLVIAAHTLGMFGLSTVTGRLTNRFGRRLMIAAGGAILIASCVITPFVTSLPMIAFGLFLLGLGWNFSFVAGSALLADNVRTGERGRAQGASEVVVALASGTGSLGTGLLYAYGGIIAIGALGLALTLLLVAVLALSTSRRVQTEVEGSSPSA